MSWYSSSLLKEFFPVGGKDETWRAHDETRWEKNEGNQSENLRTS